MRNQKSEIPQSTMELPHRIIEEISKTIVGKRVLMEDLLIALMAEGNVLMQGLPGIAKTMVAKTFSRTLGCSFRRIQFTPDVLPADILGSYIFDQKQGEFKLRKGPIFSNIVFIDEINRGTPKTQSATLEVMQERQVTIEGQTLPLDAPFMVLATINPIEQEGVYQMITSQLDRFMFRLNVDFPSGEEDIKILENLPVIERMGVNETTNRQSVLQLISFTKEVYAAPQIRDYVASIVQATRKNPAVRYGASPRAMIHLYKASKARAFLYRRSYVIPDDVKNLAPKTLAHRQWLTQEAEIEGISSTEIVEEILSRVPVPKVEIA